MKFPEYKSLLIQIDAYNPIQQVYVDQEVGDLWGTFLRMSDSRRKSRDDILLKSLENKFTMNICAKVH